MHKRAGRTLPAEVRGQLSDAVSKAEEVLWRLADGAPDDEAGLQDLAGLLNGPIKAAKYAGASERGKRDNIAQRDVDFATLAATRIRDLRRRAGLTQTDLADLMKRLGFDWKRVTVAEIETGAEGQKDRKPGRKVSLEELVGLASLFGVPMLEFILPAEDDFVHLRAPSGRAHGLMGNVVRELIIGGEGRVGNGGAQWGASRAAAGVGDDDWRPAVDYWKSLRLRKGR